MKRFALLFAIAGLALSQDGPYKILKSVKVGGEGGFDYVNADEAGRKLYVARSGPKARLTVYNLDTLAAEGVIEGVASHGAVVSAKSGHGFASSKPVTMFDSKTLAVIKKIDVEGNPDGLMYDPFNDRVYVLSHRAPNVTVINAADGTVAGTIDLGGAPEQGATDGKGKIYIDVEDKENIAVIDAKTMTFTAHYDVTGKGGTCAGLALDAKTAVLFAMCRNPANAVMLNAKTGNVISTLPIGASTDGAAFNPKTSEAFSSNADGTLNVIKVTGPASFVMEQTLKTMPGAKTMVLDGKTGHLFLIAAEFGPAPAPAQPGGRPARGPMVPDSFTILEVGK